MGSRVGLDREEGQGRGGRGDGAYYGYRNRKWTRKQTENVKNYGFRKRENNVLHQYVKNNVPIVL